jgi:hypothetical protein
MKPLSKFKALLAVSEAKTADEPDPLALALVEAERVNVDLIRENQRLRLERDKLKDTLDNFVELLEVYYIETNV